MKVVFSSNGWADHLSVAEDISLLKRLNELVEECRRSPLKGRGKPEPLRGELRGWGSRRITQEDRLVYRVAGSGDDQRLEIIQCRYRY